MGKLLLGKGKSESGVAEALYSFGQAKYSAGIMHSYRGCEAADYSRKALMSIPPLEFGFSERTSAGYPHSVQVQFPEISHPLDPFQD